MGAQGSDFLWNDLLIYRANGRAYLAGLVARNHVADLEVKILRGDILAIRWHTWDL